MTRCLETESKIRRYSREGCNVSRDVVIRTDHGRTIFSLPGSRVSLGVQGEEGTKVLLWKKKLGFRDFMWFGQVQKLPSNEVELERSTRRPPHTGRGWGEGCGWLSFLRCCLFAISKSKSKRLWRWQSKTEKRKRLSFFSCPQTS